MSRLHESWGPGPWDDEPDREEWTDEATGLEHLALRQPVRGHWCGYIRVPEGHPWRNLGRYDYPDADVHGSVTWIGPMKGEGFLVGFDCAHADDLVPGAATADQELLIALGNLAEGITSDEDVYRDLAYVRAELTKLAAAVRGAA